MSAREIGPQEILKSSFDYNMSGIYTAMPGIIVTVRDSASQLYVDVQATLNQVIANDSEVSVTERPVILNVPYSMPISKTGGLTYPIGVGNPVWIMFSMRGLDIWKRSNGYPTTPSDYRMFDQRDCIVIPAYPMSESPNDPAKRVHPHNTNDVVLVNNIGRANETEVRLSENGEVVIRPGNGIVRVEGTIIADEAIIGGIVFTTHVHGGVIPGGSNTTGPA